MTEFADSNTQQLNWVVAVRVYSISAGQTLHYHKNTPYIFTVLYFILIHLWNESTYKIHLLLQVWNEIIADNEHKLGKLGESKFIHMTVNEGGIVMFTPTLRCECAQPGLIDTIWEWSIKVLMNDFSKDIDKCRMCCDRVLTWRLPLGQYSQKMETLGLSTLAPTNRTTLSCSILRICQDKNKRFHSIFIITPL